MNFPVDDSVLANIKTQQDTDDEDVDENCEVGAETLMEVLGGFMSNGVDDPDIVEGDGSDDPLEGNEDSESIFPWCCDESEFLNPIDEFEEQEWEDVAHLRSKSKKARMGVELVGPNGIKWKSLSQSHRIADSLPGFESAGKGPAKNVSNPLEAWHLLMDIPMLNQVVKATNEIIKSIKKKEPHQKRLTDLIELKAWLGLNYLCGVLRNSKLAGPIEELWTLELGNAIFRATMTYKRFEFLSDCLRFLEKDSDLTSPLEEIASLWEKLVINCRSYYAPSDFCMIDEHILDLSVDDSNTFDHVLPSQPSIKGIRFITVCDAKTLYICNALVATHCQPIDHEVYQLVSDIKGTRRCLCLTERFTSMKLLQKLKQNQLQVVGASSRTNRDIPSELCREGQDQQTWYTSNDCFLIAGLDTNITQTPFLLTNGVSSRINAVKLYQTIKNTNCQAYEQMKSYSTKYSNSKKHRWALEFFHFMLDISAKNAWTLFRISQNGSTKIDQRDFQRQLGLYLTQPQLKQRLQLNTKLPLALKVQIAEVLGEHVESFLNGAGTKIAENINAGTISVESASIPDGIILQSREIENRRRCRSCKTQGGTKTKNRCQQCLTPFCMRHLISRCESCSNYKLKHSNQKEDMVDT